MGSEPVSAQAAYEQAREMVITTAHAAGWWVGSGPHKHQTVRERIEVTSARAALDAAVARLVREAREQTRRRAVVDAMLYAYNMGRDGKPLVLERE